MVPTTTTMLSTTNYAYTYQYGTNNNHNVIYHKLRIHLPAWYQQ